DGLRHDAAAQPLAPLPASAHNSDVSYQARRRGDRSVDCGQLLFTRRLYMSANPLVELSKLGQSVWYDNIERKLITSGELRRMIDEDDLRGVTSNPAIFEKAISGSDLYEDQIRELAARGASAAEI